MEPEGAQAVARLQDMAKLDEVRGREEFVHLAEVPGGREAVELQELTRQYGQQSTARRQGIRKLGLSRDNAWFRC